MSSTQTTDSSPSSSKKPAPPAYDWRAAGHRYYPYSFHQKQKYGERIQKVSIDAGFTCPNVDGTVAIGGCTFCDNRSFSPSRRVRRRDILEQISDGIRRLQMRYDCKRFCAYFQPATNTYAPVEKLRPLYERALEHPQVVALAIGTRPDCLPNDVLDLLAQIATRTNLSVEIGLQTIHDASLTAMNRGHNYASFVDAVQRSAGRGFEICTHVMLGLPGETAADMLATAREVARLPIDSVKIHNLYYVKHTPLGEQYERGEVAALNRDDYLTTLVDFLELLPPNMVVERISGEAPPDYFLGPSWCLDKPAVRKALLAELERRDTWQGKNFPPA